MEEAGTSAKGQRTQRGYESLMGVIEQQMGKALLGLVNSLYTTMLFSKTLDLLVRLPLSSSMFRYE